MPDPIVILDTPSLRTPVLVVGIGGWPNAGEVSTWVSTFLVKSLGAVKCAEIRADDFYDFTESRPTVSIEAGRLVSVEYPSNAFYAAQIPEPGPRDLILFVGREPHLQWNRFTEAVLAVAERLGATEICAIGGLHDHVPHTVEPRVSGLTTDPDRLERFPALGIHPSDYQGPVSIHSSLLLAASRRGIPGTSLWGHVPYYVQSSNAKVCLAVLERLQALTGLSFDLTEVRQASVLLEEQVDRIVQSKPELQEYIRELERQYSSGSAGNPRPHLRPRASEGEKVIEIDRFLRRGDDPDRPR